MAVHPALCLYGETAQRSFPLIMIVGREPNSDDGGRSRNVGLYNFDGEDRLRKKRSQCAFWNISYRLAGSRIGMTTRELKQLCRNKSASPILYADGLPNPIQNEENNKRAQRAKVEDRDIEAHANEVFSHKTLLERVSVCVLSGLSNDIFARSRKAFQERCAARNIICLEVKFFHGINARGIDDEVAGNEAASRELKRIMEDFRDSTE